MYYNIKINHQICVSRSINMLLQLYFDGNIFSKILQLKRPVTYYSISREKVTVMMGAAVQTCNYTQGESNSDDGGSCGPVTIPRERVTVMMGAAVAAFLVGKGFSLCPPQVGCFMQRYSRHTSVNWATMLATSGVGLPATSTYRENLLFLKYELNIAPNQHKSRFQTSLGTVSDYKHFRISSWISSIQLWISLESAQDQLRISSGSAKEQLSSSSIQTQFSSSVQLKSNLVQAQLYLSSK